MVMRNSNLLPKNVKEETGFEDVSFHQVLLVFRSSSKNVMFKSSSGYINLTYLLVLLTFWFGTLPTVIIQEALAIPLTLKAKTYKLCIPLHGLQA